MLVDYISDKGQLIKDKGGNKLLLLVGNAATPTKDSDYALPANLAGNKRPLFPIGDPPGVILSTFYALNQMNKIPNDVLKMVIKHLIDRYKAFNVTIPKKLYQVAAFLAKPKPKVKDESVKEASDYKQEVTKLMDAYEEKVEHMDPLKRRPVAIELKKQADALNIPIDSDSMVSVYSSNNLSPLLPSLLDERIMITGDDAYKPLLKVAQADIDTAITKIASLDSKYNIEGMYLKQLPDPALVVLYPVEKEAGILDVDSEKLVNMDAALIPAQDYIDPEAVGIIRQLLHNGEENLALFKLIDD